MKHQSWQKRASYCFAAAEQSRRRRSRNPPIESALFRGELAATAGCALPWPKMKNDPGRCLAMANSAVMWPAVPKFGRSLDVHLTFREAVGCVPRRNTRKRWRRGRIVARPSGSSAASELTTPSRRASSPTSSAMCPRGQTRRPADGSGAHVLNARQVDDGIPR